MFLVTNLVSNTTRLSISMSNNSDIEQYFAKKQNWFPEDIIRPADGAPLLTVLYCWVSDYFKKEVNKLTWLKSQIKSRSIKKTIKYLYWLITN